MSGTLCLACDRCGDLLEVNGVSVCADTEGQLKYAALDQGWKCEQAGCPEEGTPFEDRLICPACQAKHAERLEATRRKYGLPKSKAVA